jgi:Transposase DDE domain
LCTPIKRPSGSAVHAYQTVQTIHGTSFLASPTPPRKITSSAATIKRSRCLLFQEGKAPAVEEMLGIFHEEAGRFRLRAAAEGAFGGGAAGSGGGRNCRPRALPAELNTASRCPKHLERRYRSQRLGRFAALRAVSQKKRKRIEEPFGWMKTIGIMRKTRHRGRALVEWFFVLTATAYNLIRIPKILAATL